jgi:hypothetical protein
MTYVHIIVFHWGSVFFIFLLCIRFVFLFIPSKIMNKEEYDYPFFSYIKKSKNEFIKFELKLKTLI